MWLLEFSRAIPTVVSYVLWYHEPSCMVVHDIATWSYIATHIHIHTRFRYSYVTIISCHKGDVSLLLHSPDKDECSNDNALTCLYHTFLLLLCYKYQGIVKPCMVTIQLLTFYEGHQCGAVICIYVPLNKWSFLPW